MEMGRLIRLRHRRSKLYAVEETIAALNEELEFTLNYAHAMSRQENFQAAAEVIEEQRRSLARASDRMHEAVAAPEVAHNRFRVRAALAGVAATLAIASGAFASFGGSTHQPAENPRIQAIQRATEALNQSIALSDPATLQAIVIDAQNTILTAAQAAQASPSDPAMRQSLLASVEQLKSAARNPNVPAKIREQAKKVAEKVEKIVVETPPAPESSGEAATPSPTPSV
jgi:hypothetical protein